jgi:hypothetical protein
VTEPTPATPLGRYGKAAALLVVAVALAVRVPGTMRWWLNPDEGIYFSILTQPTLPAFWAEVAQNAHPPLYYLILRAVGFVTNDFLWFRALSLVAGAAAVFLLWECGREIVRDSPPRTVITGLTAAALLAASPTAVTLSQIMRPYALQLAFVAGALALLLRYGRTPERRTLVRYVVLLCLALLVHYSSILAMGALSAVALWLAFSGEMPRAARRALLLAHLVPVALVVGLYFLHLRRLAASIAAHDVLHGYLSFYLVHSPREAWLAFVGLQTTVLGRALGGPVTVLTLAALAAAAALRRWLPLVVAGSALVVGEAAAAVGVYPMGATRHAVWMLAFILPLLGWGVGRVLTAGRTWGAVGLAVVIVLILARGRVDSAVGVPATPWSASERVLTSADMTRMLDVVDPNGSPRLEVMDLQTYYLLIPFFAAERRATAPGPDDIFFDFTYGRRDIVVVRSWVLTVGDSTADPASDLLTLPAKVDRSDPRLGVGSAAEMQVVIGGWRSGVVDRLLALEDSGVVGGHRVVPGLFAFLVDPRRLRKEDADDE